jgi:hypothetical protein
MKHKGKAIFAVLIPAALLSTGSYACGQNVWGSSPASQSCNLVNIQYEAGGGDSSISYCNVTASCLTGRTVTENPNNWNSQQVTERRTTNASNVPDNQFSRLQNRSGNLVFE